MKINLPTKITLARMALIPLVIIFYYLIRVHSIFILLMTATFIVASCTDFIDGHIARSRHMVTTLGKFLDPIADKALVVTGLFIIVDSFAIPYWSLGMLGSIIIMVRELAISAFRQIAATKGIVMAADKLGKAKTIVTLIAIPALFLGLYRTSGNDVISVIGKIFMWFGIVTFVVAVILTVVSGINYVKNNKQVFVDESATEEPCKIEEKSEIVSEVASSDVKDENN